MEGLFFDSFDLIEKEPKDNSLNFVLTDAPQKNSIEIFVLVKQFRDISSSFSIKFLKMFNENFLFSF